ncbi:CAP domain-containing protein [Aquisalibacillus elongatus]
MLRPITAIVIAVVMSIILATGQVAASSQQDSSNAHAYTFTMPFSFWFQQDSQFDWNDLFNQFGQNGEEQDQQEQPAEPEESEEPSGEPVDKPDQYEDDKNEGSQNEPAEEQQQEETNEQPQQEETNNEAQQEEPQQEEPANNQTEEQSAQEQQQDQNQSSDLQSFEQQVVDLVNQERQQRGLQPLQASSELSDVARDKSRDMAENNYFSHTSPTYGSPFDMMQQYGIDYRTAGENIAMGQRSPEQVMDGWMNSEGHRENILSSDFTHIGVGYVEANGKTYWTQMFIGK